MTFEDEAVGDDVFERLVIAGDLENPPTLVAVEVVVVRFAGHFVARRLAGELDGREPAGVEEELDRPINCGDSEAGLLALGGDEHLVGAEGPVRLGKNVANRLPLISIPFGHSARSVNWP